MADLAEGSSISYTQKPLAREARGSVGQPYRGWPAPQFT
jgi:hypothetical protein